ILYNGFELWAGADEVIYLTALQELETIEQNIAAQLDFVLADIAVGECERTNALLEPREFCSGLAGKPSYIVTRNLAQCVLSFADQYRDISGRADKEADGDSQHPLGNPECCHLFPRWGKARQVRRF